MSDKQNKLLISFQDDRLASSEMLSSFLVFIRSTTGGCRRDMQHRAQAWIPNTSKIQVIYRLTYRCVDMYFILLSTH